MLGSPWRLDGHPNAAEIAAVRGTLPLLDGAALYRLATRWQPTPARRQCRAAALGVETPGVVDLLATLTEVDLLAAEAERLRLLPAATAGLAPAALAGCAFGAVGDAVAAAYARPVLPAEDYALLTAPWAALPAGG